MTDAERAERAAAAARHLGEVILAYVDAVCTPGQLRPALDAWDRMKETAEAMGWVHPKDRKK